MMLHDAGLCLPGLKMEAVEGLRVKTLRTNSMLSDDEPLYDSVASDEDYASIGDSHSAKGIKVDDKPELPPDVCLPLASTSCQLLYCYHGDNHSKLTHFIIRFLVIHTFIIVYC